MNRKNTFKIVIAFAVVLALVLPSSAMFANIEENKNVSSSKEDNNIDLQALDDSIIVTETVDWWPMARHDLANTGYSSGTAPNTNNVLWSFPTGSYVRKSPAIVDGRVYVGSEDNNLYCLNALDGSFIWSYTTGDKVYSSPAVAYGKVYVGSRDHKVYCLNASDGSFIWSYTTGDKVYSSPAVADGKVYVGSHDNNLYCLWASNGTVKWQYTTGDFIESSPAIADGKVYVGSYDNKLYCLDAEDGSHMWNYSTGGVQGHIMSKPVVVDGKAFVSFFISHYGYISCLNASDGTVIWRYEFGGFAPSSPAVANGKVFISSPDEPVRPDSQYVYCLNASDGSFIWSYTTGNGAFSSPAVADDKVYVGSSDNNIHCLNELDGSLIWKYATGGCVMSSPAIANGKMFIGSDDNNLYCFGTFPGHDVEVASIDSPITGPFDIITPEISVQNVGIYSETDVPVNLQITKIGNWNVEYDETVVIASIASEEIQTAVFPDWTPDDLGMSGSVKYHVAASVQLTGDEIPENDCETKMISLYPDDVDWWPMNRHDLNNTGFSTGRGPETNNMLWNYVMSGTAESSPTVADGKVYVGTYDDRLFCVDAYSGSFIWKYTTGHHVTSTPAVADGKVYFISEDGNIYCLDGQDGSGIWKMYGVNAQASPTIADGKVYVSGFCFDATNGSLIWQTEIVSDSSPAVVDGKVYIGSYGDNLYCLNAMNGSIIWNFPTGGNVRSSPAVVDGKVYFGSRDTNIYCVDATDGSFIWSKYLGGDIRSSPAVVDGKVFVSSYDENLYCLDALDGSLIWSYPTGGTVYSSPAVADGKVYITCDNQDKSVLCLNSSDGSLIWDYGFGFPDGYLSPVVADGKVYVCCGYNIYCFGPPDHDVGVTSIDSPVSGPAGVFTPEIMVKNFGFNYETDMPVSMQIDKISGTWTEVLFGGTGHWEQLDYASGTNYPDGTGSYFAIVDSYAHASDVFDVGLVTPPLDLSGLSSVTLEFEMNFKKYDTDWAEVNAFSGEIGENLATYTSSTQGHKTITFDPSGYVDPSEVYIEFYYSTGGEKHQFGFAIDDVIINEIGLSEGFEGPVFPPVVVEPVPEYTETVDIDINIGEKSVMFPDWTPVGYGSIGYLITSRTQLMTDGEPRNDCKVEVITLDYGEPFSPEEVNSNDAFDIDDGDMLSIDWWPMLGHDPERTGFSTSIAPNTYNLLWKRATGYWTTSPAVVDGRVFTGSGDDYVYCLDAEDGSIIWKYDTGDAVPSSPAVADGKVYIGSKSTHGVGGMFCLNATDGSLIWNYNYNIGRVTSSPAVADGNVYFGSGHNFYCLNATDGSLIWSYPIADRAWNPAIADGKVYFGTFEDDNNLYCLDAMDGSLIWRYTISGEIRGSLVNPVVSYGKVYITSMSLLACLDASDGSLIWTYPTIRSSSLATAYGYLYLISNYRLYCLNAMDGSFIWGDVYVGLSTHPSIADGKVFCGCFCLDAYDGSVIWESDISVKSFAIANGKVYACHVFDIYCFGSFDHDFSVASINSPFGGVTRIFTPEAVVENYGLNNEVNVPVNMEVAIFVCPNFIVEYNKTVHVDIDGLENKIVTFPDWTPEHLEIPYGFIRYKSTAKSQLENDVDPDNDQKIKVFSLIGGEDTTPPVTTHGFDGTIGENGWYISDVTITLTATDDIFGVDVTYYRIDGDDWDEYHNPVVVSDDGEHTLEYYSIDNAENIEDIKGPFDFKIDQTSPVTTCDLDGTMEGGVYITDVTVTLTATDDMSGVAETFYRLNDGEWQEYSEFTVSEDGDHTISFYSIDNAGNTEEPKTESFTIQHPCPIEIIISGGLGVNAVITNTGEEDIIDLDWSIDITGGLLDRIDKEVNGTIPIIASGAEETVKSGIFFGLGSISITVTAGCAEETVAGKQFIIFTKVG